MQKYKFPRSMEYKHIPPKIKGNKLNSVTDVSIQHFLSHYAHAQKCSNQNTPVDIEQNLTI